MDMLPSGRAQVDSGITYEIEWILLPQVRLFIETFTEKVYPPISDPEREAERLGKEFWDEQMQRRAREAADVGSIADDANQLSIDSYFRLAAMQFTVVNLFTAGLYHLFEQQVADLLRRWDVDKGRQPLDTLRSVLTKQFGFSFETLSCWPKIQQVNDVANVVKHAEGSSAERLRKTCPKLFELPTLRKAEYRDLRTGPRPSPIVAPLTGEDVYITKEDFDLYAEAIVEFWEWLLAEMEKLFGAR